MTNVRRFLMMLAGVVAGVLPLTVVAHQPADPAAALTGGWKLNEAESLNPNGPRGSARADAATRQVQSGVPTGRRSATVPRREATLALKKRSG